MTGKKRKLTVLLILILVLLANSYGAQVQIQGGQGINHFKFYILDSAPGLFHGKAGGRYG